MCNCLTYLPLINPDSVDTDSQRDISKKKRLCLGLLGTLEISIGIYSVVTVISKFGADKNLAAGLGLSIPYGLLVYEGVRNCAKSIFGQYYPFSSDQTHTFRRIVKSAGAGVVEIVSSVGCSVLALSALSKEGDTNFAIGMAIPYTVVACEGVRRFA